jgi:hypothetical protein
MAAEGEAVNNWIPVIGTLLGATIAGVISIVLSWLSNRRTEKNTKLLLAEERAKWAVEKRLERLQVFYSAIEKLQDVTSQFRVQQVWHALIQKEEEVEAPRWVQSYDKARGEWEDQFGVVTRNLLFQDEGVRTEFEKRNIKWVRWMLSKTTDEGVQILMDLEDDIQKFKEWLAKRYRDQFEDRYRGLDHAI